jgi:chemotaxis protein methyltransferase CheR
MELSQQTHAELARWIHRLCGLVVGQDKGYLLRHRLTPLVRSEGCDSFEQLLGRLQSRNSARLCAAVVEAMTTKETSFFRDHAVFEALQERVLPECAATLTRPGAHRQRVRLWCAGCATGEECYSLAMLVRELIDGLPGLDERQFTILASDISAEALARAQAGQYGRTAVTRGVSAPRLARHFAHRAGQWTVAECLRRLVQFRRVDLLNLPSRLGPFDLVLCRNVLIYFDLPTRRRVCHDLGDLVQPGGYLALGAAESLFGLDVDLEPVRFGRVLLYRKPQ